MPTEVLFTVAILLKRNPHLLTATIDSLVGQKEKPFEVLLVGTGRFEEFPIPIRTLEVREGTDGEWMNRAVSQAHGCYIQFLYPGDRYISQQSFSYLSELIQTTPSPHLVYCAFLQRDFESPPQAISFPLNIQSLQKGDFPTMYRSSWFLREKIVEMGGFNQRLEHRPSFDFLCRLFLHPNSRAIYTRRVLTDYQPSKTSSHAIMSYAAETFRILYRHFGTRSAFRWFIMKDRSWLLRWALHFIKRSFLRRAG